MNTKWVIGSAAAGAFVAGGIVAGALLLGGTASADQPTVQNTTPAITSSPAPTVDRDTFAADVTATPTPTPTQAPAPVKTTAPAPAQTHAPAQQTSKETTTVTDTQPAQQPAAPADPADAPKPPVASDNPTNTVIIKDGERTTPGKPGGNG